MQLCSFAVLQLCTPCRDANFTARSGWARASLGRAAPGNGFDRALTVLYFICIRRGAERFLHDYGASDTDVNSTRTMLYRRHCAIKRAFHSAAPCRTWSRNAKICHAATCARIRRVASWWCRALQWARASQNEVARVSGVNAARFLFKKQLQVALETAFENSREGPMALLRHWSVETGQQRAGSTVPLFRRVVGEGCSGELGCERLKTWLLVVLEMVNNGDTPAFGLWGSSKPRGTRAVQPCRAPLV